MVARSLAMPQEKSLRKIRDTRHSWVTESASSRRRLSTCTTSSWQQPKTKTVKKIPQSVHKAPPYMNRSCKEADEACTALYTQYARRPTEDTWKLYSQARRQRISILAEQQRRLFALRVQKLDPSRAAD